MIGRTLARRMASLSSMIGVIVAVVMAAVPPVGYLTLLVQQTATALQADADVKAAGVGELIARSPDTWQLQEAKLATLLGEKFTSGIEQRSSVVGPDAAVVKSRGGTPRWPVVTRSAPLFDAGIQVGSVQLTRSLHGALWPAGGLGLLGAVLGSLVYLFLRVLPLRELKIANENLFNEKERAHVTLDSIGDAVVTTDTQMRVLYLNPVASVLIGLSIEEARNRPMREIFRIVNENTRQPVANPIEQCIREQRIVEMANHTLLLRPDGTEFSIEDSAAPIRDANGHVIGAVMVFHDVSERKLAQQRMDFLAYHDSLTGLPNRISMRERLKHAMAHAKRHELNVAVLMLDLDEFKAVNDTFGHAAGDTLLVEVASRLKQCVRLTDTVARLGGDEFIVVLEDLPDLHAADAVIEKIIAAIAEPVSVGGHEITVTTSVGIGGYPADALDIENLLKSADAAMYHAKAQGGGASAYHEATMNEAGLRRLKMQHALRQAERQGEFELHYQPKQRICDGAIVGMEALMRWTSPELGSVPPSVFIPLLEQSGQIIQVGEWALRQAARQAMAWLNTFGLPLRMSVNLSPRQFRKKDLAETVFAILADTRLPAHALELEITESMLVDSDLASRQLAALKAGGIRVSLDDFGTGYSSLSYLRSYAIDVLKIDRSFVRDIGVDSSTDALVKAIVVMAHSLNIVAIAEGVELAQQEQFLRGVGCDEIQGYLLARPMPAYEFEAWLGKHIAAAATTTTLTRGAVAAAA